MNNKVQKKFWNRFAKLFWEKKPMLVENFDSAIVDIKQDEIFKMLVDYSDQCRKIRNAEGFKLYVERQLVHSSEALLYLPVKQDGSLQGYHSRMERIFPDYCLVCDELLQVNQNNWSKLQDFTNTVFAHVGFPNRFVEMGLYLGNYRKTPFGVHVDGCGVFSFPVVGTKIFRLWKPEFAKKNPSLDRAFNYSRFNKDSQIFKANPGDMTYWPSSAWHIAESSGSFSATWSLGIWINKTHRDKIVEAIYPMLESRLGPNGISPVTKTGSISSGGEVYDLPKNYQQSIESLRNISSDEWYDGLMISWLKLISMQGFKTTPNLKLTGKDFLKGEVQVLNPGSFAWAKLKSRSKTVYAFQGRIIEMAPSNSIQDLIQALNKGQPCRIYFYLKGAKHKQEIESVRTLLGIGKV